MNETEIYLKCIELASQPVHGTSYNYDSLLEMANRILPDTSTELEKIAYAMLVFSKNGNDMHQSYSNSDGKIPLNSLNFPIIKTLPLDDILQKADLIFDAVKAKSVARNASMRESPPIDKYVLLLPNEVSLIEDLCNQINTKIEFIWSEHYHLDRTKDHLSCHFVKNGEAIVVYSGVDKSQLISVITGIKELLF